MILLRAPKGAMRLPVRPAAPEAAASLLLLPGVDEAAEAELVEWEDGGRDRDAEDAAPRPEPPLYVDLMLLADTSPTQVTTEPTGRQRSVLRMPCLVICL